MVAIHLRTGAVLQKVSGFLTGPHLRAVGTTVAYEGPAGRRSSDRTRCVHLDWRRSLTESGHDAYRTEHQQCQERPGPTGSPRPWLTHTRGLLLAQQALGTPLRPPLSDRTGRWTHDPNRTQLAVRRGLLLEGHQLTHRGPHTISRKCRDVYEKLGAALCRGDEAETAIVVPSGQSAMCTHSNHPGKHEETTRQIDGRVKPASTPEPWQRRLSP